MFSRMTVLRFQLCSSVPAILLVASGALAQTTNKESLLTNPFDSSSPAAVTQSPETQSPPSASPAPSAKSDGTKTGGDWQVVKVGVRDYLSADNIAKFYSLQANVDASGKTVVLSGDRTQLQFTSESREAIINGVRNWLCFPIVLQNGKFLVSRSDLSKTIEPQLRPFMIQRNSIVQTVVVDAGHGGSDKGARSADGTEKQYALDVARRLRPLLQASGFKVIMTRENDAFLPLQLRARIANQANDAIFVSIHFNSTSKRDATGFEIYSLTPQGAPSTADDALALSFVNMEEGSPVDAQSFALSAAVYHSMIGHFSEFDRGIKRARFAVLRHTKIPAILVEGGFLSQEADSKLIADPAWRGKLARAISIGIENYRNATEKKQRLMLVADYRAQEAREISLVDLAQPPSRLEPSPQATPGPDVIALTDPGTTPEHEP